MDSAIDNWYQYAAKLPDVIPDSALADVKEKFFRENVLPGVMQSGQDISEARDRFYSSTPRKNEANFPRVNLAAASAMEALMSPIGGMAGDRSFQQKLTQNTTNQRNELLRQEGSPIIPEMIGQGIGAAPYLIGGTEIAGAVGLAGVAGRIAGFAISSSAMEAAKAEDGQRLIKGLEGAAEGVAMGGIFEGILHAPGLIKGSPLATAVEKTIKGTATPAEQEVAKAVEVANPKAGEEVIQQAAKDAAAATKMGVPKNPPQVQSTGNAKVRLTRKDGSVYEVPDSTDLQQKLAGGESIDSILGSAKEVHKVTQTLDKANAKAKKYDVPIPPERPVASPVSSEKRSIADPEFYTQMVEAVRAQGKGSPSFLQRSFKLGYGEAERVLKLMEDDGIVGPKDGSKPRVVNTPIRNSATTDSFEADLKSPEAEELPVAFPSASDFSDFSEDPFQRTLQTRILDKTIPLFARNAAYVRLQKLNVTAADKMDEFIHGEKPAEGSIVAEDSAVVVEKRKESSPLIPIYKAMSAKQEVNINRLTIYGGLGYKEAEAAIQRGIDEGILTPSRMVGGVGVEVQNYKVKPRKITVEDLPESGAKFQSDQPPSVDDGLKRLREKIKEKYPNAFQEEPPIDENAPSELELQLRASLKALGKEPNFQDPASYDHRYFSQVPRGEFVQLAMETQSFETPGEAARYYDNNVKTYNPGEPGSIRYRPLANTGVESFPGSLLPEGSPAATYPAGLDMKPFVAFSEPVPRSTIYHEGTHALLSAAGLSSDVAEIFGDKFASNLFQGAFNKEAAEFYATKTPQYIPEETFVWLAQAYRHGDRRLLQSFIDADGSEAELSTWYSGKVNEVLGRTNALEDSLYKRRLQTRLRDLVNRSGGSLQEMSAESSVLGYQVDHIDGQYALRGEDGTIKYFQDRNQISDYLRDNHMTPMISPELVDLSGLPEGTPMYQSSRPPGNRAPIHTNPAPPELLPGKDINAGMHVLSYYFRPFYSWVDSVADRFKWPELSQKMRGIQDAEVTMNNAMREHLNTLKDTIGTISHKRQDMLFKFVEAPADRKVAIAESLGLTKEEIDAVAEFNTKFTDPLESELGNISLEHFIRKYHGPGQRDLATVSSEGITNRAAAGDIKFLGDSYRTGDLDPRDQNLLNIASEYLRAGMRKKFMEDPLKAAAELVNATGPDKVYVAGNLQPLLARHINYLRGIPDYGARIIHEGIQTSMNIINEGLEKVNKALPDSWKIEPLEDPENALKKWITYNYAGGLMLRAMVPFRDSLQIFLTTYPILGGKYLKRGMQRAFEYKSDEDVLGIAKQYGAMLEDRDILKYVQGVESAPPQTKIDKGIESAMKVMQFSNNSNRLATFWGHAERVLDTLDELGTGTIVDRETFAEKAGMNFLSKVRRQQYLDELLVVTPEKRPDYAYRIAKDLVDVSQWGTSRGSAPGFYKYALGKLFGQYGTWPLNYVEYARKLTGLGDSAITGKEKVQAFTRLGIAHMAVLKMGELTGVDTGGWVFTQPMAYGGGPMFSAVTSIPGSMDFETEQGAQARRNVFRPIWPMSVPGGLFAKNVLTAIRKDDPDFWKILLGFHPMERSEYGKGIHLLPPNNSQENFR